MRLPPLLIVLSSAVLAAAAVAPEARAGGLPRCNAKHRRPANPFGSVLSGGLKPAVTVSPVSDGKGSDKVAGVAAASTSMGRPAQKISRAALRASLIPCGSDRA